MMTLRSMLLKPFLLLLCLPTLGACSSMRQFEWTEDVALSDGRTIVVQRTSEYRPVMDVGAGFQRGLLFNKGSITADLPPPISRKVSWEGSLSPLALDIVGPDNAAYLVCDLATGAGRNEWKVPPYEFYVAFRLGDQGWQRIPLAELPLSVQPNLFVAEYSLFIRRRFGDEIPEHISTVFKKQYQSKIGLDKTLTSIIRLPTPPTSK